MSMQAGMQAGAAVGGPWGAVAGAVIGAGIGDYQGGDAPGAGGGGPFMGGSSGTAAYGTGIDKAGAVYNFGSDSTATTSSQRAYNQPQADAIAAPISIGAQSWAVPAVIAGAAVLLLIMRKRKG